MLLQLAHGDLDVGFYLATTDELRKTTPKEANEAIYPSKAHVVHVFTAQSATKLIAIPSTQFNYRVLASAGWGPQVQGRAWYARVIADKVSLGCTLCFVYPAAPSHELVIGAALRALDNVWGQL